MRSISEPRFRSEVSSLAPRSPSPAFLGTARRISGVTALALVLLPQAHAALTAYEPFNYTIASQVNAQTGGGSFGFSTAWSGGSAGSTVGSGSLPGFNPVGNRATMNANSLTTPLTRTLTAPLGISAGTTYFSYLLRPQASIGTKSAELQLNGSAASVGFGLKSNSGAYLIDQVGTAQTTSSSTATVNSPILLVLKAVFGAGAASDTFSLFINPGVGSTEGAADATRSFNVGTISGLSITGNLAFSVDEIKVGTSYADVVPEPATNAAISAVGLLIAGQWMHWRLRQKRSRPTAPAGGGGLPRQHSRPRVP